MATILISIHKEHCDALFSGKKQFEFRKTIPGRPVSTLIVYEAKGCGMIIGKLEVKDMLIGTPEEVWNQTKDLAGIDRESFFAYYKNKANAIAYVVESYTRFAKPKSLSDYGISRPPQNYIWINCKHPTTD